jgi:hypothetical protein
MWNASACVIRSAFAQLGIGDIAVDAGRHEGDEVARGGEHLSGARKIEIALLVSGSADRRAVPGVTLDGFSQELRRHDRAVIPPAFGDQRRMHAERRQNAAFDKLGDRNSIAAFEG